jgi:tripartite-type tricarboxylate transporter receptor subunit TctC
MRFAPVVAVAFALVAALSWRSARAEAVADFYKGKTVTVIVGYAPGGNYDTAGRLVGRTLVKYLPGKPGYVVQNMPAASGLTAVGHMYNVAAKDGTVISTIGRAIPQLAYLGAANIRFAPEKFTWLGTMSSYADDAFPIFIMASRPIESWKDLRQPGKKIVLGAVGAGSTNLTFPLIARDVLKLNIDVIRGYSGAAPIYLAMQSGEVDGQSAGFASIKAAQRALWEGKQLRFLIQFGRMTRLAELADVPTGQELAANDADRALIAFAESPFFMAMPFIAPPDVPPDRAEALRTAFDRAMADEGLRAEAKRLDMDVSPLDGKAVAKLVRDLSVTPADVVARFKAISEAR